ncbi:MAG: sulfite dehydrogenase [Acidobacteria bacterium RIFCSPLOWO2_12_FULL_60_22]|nr:MAG: sulfite dehydrogenase [Acidobacteria bacterium RIFCSPLOWO2_12_FULL_60_22]
MDSKQPNRRKFLKGSAALVGLAVGAVRSASGQTPASGAYIKGNAELIAYGQRSRFETAVRMSHGGRSSPDAFGLVMHVATPLQESVGVITPSALHYVATTRGSYIPDIDPKEHRLMVHGMVDRPLTFTMQDLKRLPSVTRLHFVECAANRPSAKAKSIQESHGMTSCAEWTGVLLSVLLKEAGVKGGASWIVAEGAEEVKGTSSIPLAKAMEDCLVCYGMNGEAVRPQHGYPLRLLVPGFEGIFNVKWLRRIKAVDQYYMTYNDYGHLRQGHEDAALGYQIGPKSVITYPCAGQQLPGKGFYEIKGLAWSGGGAIRRVEVSTDGGRSWKDAEIRGTAHRMAHTRFSLNWNWDGTETAILSRCTDERGQIQPTRAQVAEFFKVPLTPEYRVPGQDNTIQTWRIASNGSVHNAYA